MEKMKHNYLEYIDNFSKYKNVKSDLVYEQNITNDEIYITVVIPTYNHLESFKQALDSCSLQIFKNFKVLVSDDSPDEIIKKQHLEIIKSFKNLNIQYYRNEKNLGLFGNWNRCIELAPTELLVFLHDDDLLLPTSLSTLFELHQKNKKNCIFVNHLDVDENLNQINNSFTRKKTVNVSYFDVFMGCNVSTGCGCLFIKEQLLQIGGYYEEYYPTADWVMIIKLIEKFGLLYYGTPLVKYRVCDENTSASVYDSYSKNLDEYRKALCEYITLPKKILKTLLFIRFKCDEYAIKKRWMKDDNAKLELTLLQKVILLFAKIWCKLKWI